MLAETFDLTDSSGSDALVALSKATGAAFVVTPDATPNVLCARITMTAAKGASMASALASLELLFAAEGLQLEKTERGYTVRRGVGIAVAAPDCGREAPLAQEPAAPPPNPGAEKRIKAGIRKRPDGDYDITKEALEEILRNHAILQARFIPNTENGVGRGAKLYGIRKDSILSRMGFENGDLALTINGFDLSSPESALAAYAGLPKTETATVQLERRGEPLTLTFHHGLKSTRSTKP